MNDVRPRTVIVRRINLLWYPLVLVPIAALFLAAAYGLISPWFGLIGFFGLIFWLFSFLFAIYSLFRRPPNREPRQ
ncbi:MAG: hypothetical protein EOP19_02200 [Hyphomicrobiales bacterium]|nr:MAG: hypothetical protein EOP19_02200 [Hyphomicrobiales bacterium]